MSRAAAVVFDLDGTLVDSLPGIIRATRATVETHLGRPAPSLSPHAVRQMVGEGARALVTRAFASEGAPMPEASMSTWQEEYGRHAPVGTSPMPGATALLRGLRADGVRLGLCTNKPHEATLALLANLGWQDAFDAVRGAGAAPADKPDPRHLLTVLGDLGVGARAAWFVGDSPTDAATGRAAGVHTVLLRHGYSRTPVDRLPAEMHLDDLPALGRILGLIPG
ncbi:MAG: HAD-IA family hydrolase [Myxococcota bacterium]|nr:HAD-IA family hydrolase [Myxococcota bacterium]